MVPPQPRSAGRRWPLPSPLLLRFRRAGRVILLDPGDRVLLMRYDSSPPTGSHWATPGGGLNRGEGYRAGAARELSEETGWTDITLLREVHRRMHLLHFDGTPVCQRERFYLARTEQDGREICGVAAMHASDHIAAWRWWTLAELDATPQAVWPAGLAALIRRLLAGR